MHEFRYVNGRLHCEDVAVAALVKKHGTPLYVYSQGTFTGNYERLTEALEGLDHQICYAMKANSNLAVLRLFARLGAGFDLVSGGELQRVIAAGGEPAKCVFAGVGKSEDEIRAALKAGIYCFNVESIPELERINQLAGRLRKKAPVALRVNPNVDAHTHAKITTGTYQNKFGIPFEDIPALYAKAARMKHLRLRGLQMHIGSQLTETAPFVAAVRKVAPLAAELRARHGIEFWALGGGIGIVYDPALASGTPDWWAARAEAERPLTIEQYAGALVPRLEGLGLKILLEPGRYLVGNAGVLLTRCLYEKQGSAKTFKVVDAGMNDLIRPALYQGHHEIVPVREPGPERKVVDVVGPICETGDFFCQDRELPDFGPGETIALMSAGAYGFAMASNYNTRPLPAEVIVEGDQARLVRRRQSFDGMVAPELL